MADAVFIAVVSLAMGSGFGLTSSDGDLGRHLRVGNWIIDNLRIPTTDMFSHTMEGAAFVPHEWLSEVLFALANGIGGLTAVALLTSVVIAVPFAALIRVMHKRGVPLLWLVTLTVLVAAASRIHWLARPHIFTFAFALFFVTRLEDFRRGERSNLWVLVPLTALWANIHGAFIVGFVLIGAYWLGWVAEHRNREGHGRHLALVGVTAFGAAAILNPAGPELILNSVGYLTSGPLIHLTQEYQSPNFHDPGLWPFMLLLLLAVATLGRQSPTTRILVLMWSVFALFSARNVPLFALICGPLVAEVSMPDRDTSQAPESPRVSGLSILAPVALIVLTILYATLKPDHFAFPPDRFPTAATEEMQDVQLGRVFNEFMWGGYLLYCCWPEIHVFIDGQTDFYGTEISVDYLEAIAGSPDWEGVLDQYEIDSVLVPPDVPLAQILVLHADWEEIYRDETAVVFTRTPASKA